MFPPLGSPRKTAETPQNKVDWVEATPDGVMNNPIFDCCVEGCKLHHEQWHKHANRDLGNWVKMMRGEITMDYATGKWA